MGLKNQKHEKTGGQLGCVAARTRSAIKRRKIRTWEKDEEKLCEKAAIADTSDETRNIRTNKKISDSRKILTSVRSQ